MKKCGIYKILNKHNNNVYIGQSINISDRWIRHRYQLNNNTHNNKKLQNSWNKHGKDSFEFSIILLCSKDELDDKEKIEVEKIPKNKRYNIATNYCGLRGKNNPFYGKKHTKEVKEKLSILFSQRTGDKNSNFGNKYSEETRIKAGHNKKTKLTKDQVLEIIKIKNKTHQEIADIYGISRSVITRILNGKRWGLITKIGDRL